LYKLCHIHLHGQSREYQWESKKNRQRIRRLKTVLNVSSWSDYTEGFDEIFFVRDAFVHSFIEIENIKYRGIPLSECFGNSYLGDSMRGAAADGARIFMDDVTILFEPIIMYSKRFS
jgi:hypothetical protein